MLAVGAVVLGGGLVAVGVTEAWARLSDAAVDPALAPRTAGSAVPWDALGAEGRAFVAGGPSRAEIAAVAGGGREPVRVYVGLGGGATPADRVRLAVAGLERTGGFRRSVLAVVVPSGTGFVNPVAADGLEYLHRGDTAIVAVQYSRRPSWLALPLDGADARETGRLLLEAVRSRLATVPASARPRLVLYGESIGAYGSEAALAPDALGTVDGALWVGPPESSPLYRRLVTPDGRRTTTGAVRIATGTADLATAGPWPRPRILYLAHDDDPVVRWSPEIAVRRPPWLADDAPWIPLVTFLQVSGDLVQGSVGDGTGHRYDSEIVAAWAAVTDPPVDPAVVAPLVLGDPPGGVRGR